MKTFRKSLAGTAVLIILLYLGVCAYFYFIQNRILFHPRSLAENHRYSYSFDFEERWFDVTDGARIHAIHAKAPDSARGLIFWMHGNGGNNETRPNRFTTFLDLGYDILYPDYREYGKSTGELRNEDDLTGDMKLVYKEILEEYDEKNIWIGGYSMGTGVAAQIAAENDPAGLMLWTPYYSMVDMKNARYWFLPSFLVRYPLRTDLALPEIEEPIVIFYAAEDETLPVDRAMKLNDLLKASDRYILLEGQGHNLLHDNAQLQTELSRILN